MCARVCACARVRFRVVACLFSTMHLCPLAVHEYLAFKQCKGEEHQNIQHHHVHTIAMRIDLNVLFFDDGKCQKRPTIEAKET